jgi:hypothetical protein
MYITQKTVLPLCVMFSFITNALKKEFLIQIFLTAFWSQKSSDTVRKKWAEMPANRCLDYAPLDLQTEVCLTEQIEICSSTRL